jgi:hypothetical protein
MKRLLILFLLPLSTLAQVNNSHTTYKAHDTTEYTNYAPDSLHITNSVGAITLTSSTLRIGSTEWGIVDKTNLPMDKNDEWWSIYDLAGGGVCTIRRYPNYIMKEIILQGIDGTTKIYYIR